MKTLCLVAMGMVSSVAFDGWAQTPAAPNGDADVEAACVSSFEKGQELRKAGKLMDAKEELERCAASDCPTELSDKCARWRGQVVDATPSIIVTAKEPGGKETLEVRVTDGGKRLRDRLDTHAIPLDPGSHQLRFELAGAAPVEQKVVVREGEKNKAVVVGFKKLEAVAPRTPKPLPHGHDEPAPSTAISPVLWAGVAVTGVGLLVGAITGGIAIAKYGDIEDKCQTTGCEDADIAKGENFAHASTAGFVLAGIGGALTIVGIVLTVTGDEESSSGADVVVGPTQLGMRLRF